MAEQTTVFLEEHYEPWDRWFENRDLRLAHGRGHLLHRGHGAQARRGDRAPAAGACRGAARGERGAHEHARPPRGCWASCSTRSGVRPLHDCRRAAARRGRGLWSSVRSRRRGRERRTSLRLGLPARRRDPRVRRVLDEGTRSSDAERGRALLAPDAGAQSWIAVPLRAGGEVIGLCAVESSAAERVRPGGRRLGRGADRAGLGSDRERAPARPASDAVPASSSAGVGELAEAQRVAHIGSFEWDIAANRITWSDELYRIYGLDPASFTGDVRDLRRTYPSGRPRRRSVADDPARARRAAAVAHAGAHRPAERRGSPPRDLGRGRRDDDGSARRGCSASATT